MAHQYPRALGFRECNGRFRTILPNHILYRRHLAGRPAAVWGNRHCFPGRAPRELARGAVIDTAPIVLFILGGLIVRIIPLLAKPASDLLDNMHHGSVPITLATPFINGELRSFSSATLPAASLPTSPPRHPYPTSRPHYRYRRNEHSLLAHCLHPHRRHHGTRGPADFLISATTPHLAWSIGMAFLLPVVMQSCGLQHTDKLPIYPRTKSLVQCTL